MKNIPWEYVVRTTEAMSDAELTEFLDEQGWQDWELVAINFFDKPRMFFKRPRLGKEARDQRGNVKVGGTSKIANCSTDNRSEFMRDAEAANRLNSPTETLFYLEQLCRRRALMETYTFTAPCSAQQENASKVYFELMEICYHRGLVYTSLTHAQFKAKVTIRSNDDE